jgi:hypothetical protein
MNHLAPLLILSAGPAFTSPDITQRKLVAEAWSRRHGVAFSGRALKSPEQQEGRCVQLRAPAPAGCAEVLALCPFGSSAGSCSGSWQVEQGLSQPNGGASFELVHRFGWEPDTWECERNSLEVWHLADGGRLTVSERSRREEIEHCLREERAHAKRQETNLRCDVMAVNPCLREAYLSCSGRLYGERLKRTTWVSWADAGEPQWEHPLGLVEDEPFDAGGGE